MNSSEIRRRFIKFFEERGHKIVPSSSLVPDDPSVLLTTAGMQQFKPYLTGAIDPVKDFGSRTVFTFQKCFRTTDIDETGDASHLTFFEMVGNFSFGDYFKEKAIPLSFELLTSKNWLALDPNKIFVTAFKGDSEVPRDHEAIKLWQEQFKSAGIDAKIDERIFLYGREKNWWEAGVGPAGPDAEMFYDFGTPHNIKFGPTCHPNCDCGRFVEIGNDVFVQYNKTKDGKYEPLTQKSIDNGRGFERLVMVVQGKKTIFETDLFSPLLDLLPSSLSERTKRIVADHARGIAFLISDGVRPSNKESGYILRRLMRRVITHEYLASSSFEITELLKIVVTEYKEAYPALNENVILEEFNKEKDKFLKTIKFGLKELEKTESLNAESAFRIFESYGLPYEVIKELGGEKANNLKRDDFDAEFKKHQEKSRAGLEKKFGGHGLLLDTGELKAGSEEELKKVTRLHTATHLMQQALRNVLGKDVHQAGSDITSERTRFDFTFSRKLTSEEIQKVEEEVNKIIKKDLPMQKVVLPKIEAEKTGALYFFKEKYPDPVNVYFVGKTIEDAYSKEFCGGPHVTHTGEIGQFKIIKEEATGAGIRRIRASIE